MEGRLSGRKALVTGGDSGIGRAVVLAFARQGADVAFVYNSDDRSAAATAGEVEEIGRRCRAIRADVGSEPDVVRVWQEALGALGGIDVLVNVAGVEQRGAWEDFALDDWERILRTNLTGSFLMIREGLRRGALRKGSRVVNTGSIQGFEGSADDPAYSSSKGAIHAMTKSLAKYLVDRRILVNCVSPGPVDTPMLRDQTPKLLAGSEQYPLGTASPDQIAQSYVFLASAAGDCFTGTILAPTAGKVVAS